MTKLTLFTGAALSALVLATGVKAADMPAYYEQPAQVEFGGWYLRGDVGASHQRADSIFNPEWELNPAIDEVDVHANEFDASWFVGLGIGYQFTDYFRADITGEYRGPSNFRGLDSLDTDDDGDTDDVVNDFRTEKSEWTFLANVYWDIMTWHSITPFIGAGVGASYNRIDDLTDTNLLDPEGGAFCASSNGCAGSNGEWDLAWALHAGLAFAVTPNMVIEVAYRYLHLGDAESDNIIGNDGTDDFDNPFQFDDLSSHDVKVGLRYSFN